MSLSDAQWASLAADLRRVLDRMAPEWTDSDPHDPGLTLVALFAFLAEELTYRSNSLSTPARRLASDAVRRATAFASALAPASDPTCDDGGLRRVSYFAGQLLGADDFQVEQKYLLDRLARRNRLLYGAGIVDGLAVTIETGADASPPQVVVSPGLAFDQLGREIALDAPSRAPLPASGDALLVQLSYRERACGALPAAPSSGSSDPGGDTGTTRPTRIIESFALMLTPSPAADSVAIARVHRSRGRWRVDPKFPPPRLRRRVGDR